MDLNRNAASRRRHDEEQLFKVGHMNIKWPSKYKTCYQRTTKYKCKTREQRDWTASEDLKLSEINHRTDAGCGKLFLHQPPQNQAKGGPELQLLQPACYILAARWRCTILTGGRVKKNKVQKRSGSGRHKKQKSMRGEGSVGAGLPAGQAALDCVPARFLCTFHPVSPPFPVHNPKKGFVLF